MNVPHIGRRGPKLFASGLALSVLLGLGAATTLPPGHAVLAQDDGADAADDETPRRERRRDRDEALEPAAAAATPGAEIAVDDRDCIDFPTREEAQAVLDADPGDPFNLDPNGDGIACGLLPSQDDVDGGDAAFEDQPADDSQRRNRPRDRASAGQPVTCDTLSQEEAQAILDVDSSDPEGLDPDGDGIACESDELAQPDDAGANRRNRDRANDAPADVSAPPADLDCVNFSFQDEAQLVLDDDRTDPYNLDPNGDGFACTSLPSRGVTVRAVPSTGSGAGSTALVVAVAAAGAAAGAAALRRRAV